MTKTQEQMSDMQTKELIQPMVAERVRYHLLDTLRGLCILGVLVFHTILDINNLGIVNLAFLSPENSVWIDAIRVIGVAMFLIISGICSWLSRSNLRRGLIVLGCASIISAVTYFVIPSFFIYIGILHLLGICMVLSHFIRLAAEAFLRKRTNSQNDKVTLFPAGGAVVLLMVFILTLGIHSADYGIGIFNIHFPLPEGGLYGSLIGNILGFGGYEFTSADYFPILPWAAAFFAGLCLGVYFKKDKVPAIFTRVGCRPLTFIGRNTLIIYMLHQPVIYGLMWVLAAFLK